MATIPVFQGPVGPTVLPTASPVQSLDSVIDAITRGTAEGLQRPNLAGAIVEGLQGAAKTYQDYKQQQLNEEIARSNMRAQDVNIRKAEFDLEQAQEREAILGNLPEQVARGALENKQVELQQEAENLNRKRELQSILDAGDPLKVEEALLSGRYSSALASDKDFAKEVFRVGTINMRPELADYFDEESKRRTGDNWWEKHQIERAEKQQDELTKEQKEDDAVLSDSAFSEIMRNARGIPSLQTKSGEVSLPTILRRAEFARKNSIQLSKDRKKVIRGDDGKLIPIIPAETNATELAQNSQYVMYDPESGAVLKDGINEATMTTIDKGIAIANKRSRNPVSQGIAETRQAKADREAAEKKLKINKGESADALIDEALGGIEEETPPPKKITTPNTIAAKEALASVKFGTSTLRSIPGVRVALANTLAISDDDDHKKEIDTVLDYLETNRYGSLIGPSSVFYKDVSVARDVLIEMAIREDYEENKDRIDTLYDAELKKYKSTLVGTVSPINSPFDLYRRDRLPVLQNLFTGFMIDVLTADSRQRDQEIKQGKLPSSLQATISKHR